MPEWARQLQARGWGSSLSIALDVVEPLAPLLAQGVWVAQPVLGLWLKRELLADLAHTLETPGELERVRQALDDNRNRR